MAASVSLPAFPAEDASGEPGTAPEPSGRGCLGRTDRQRRYASRHQYH
jgi:hypothetical protein